MKYEVGDEIIVLISNEEGRVVEIMSDKMVMIEVRGVKFPAYMDQIDFPYFQRFSKKPVVVEAKRPTVFLDNIPREKPKKSEIKVADGVWLVMIPKFSLDDFNDEIVENLKIYLVNKTECSYEFVYKQLFLSGTNFEIHNQVAGFQDFYLHDIAFESVNDSPSFHVDFSLATPEKKKAEHFETSLKLKPKQVFQRIEQMKEKNEPTLSYKLFDTYPDRPFEDKFELTGLAAKGFKIYKANEARQHLDPAREIIDLHIEKLVDDWQGLSNFEILNIQLKEFEKWYDLAIAHRQRTLILIHGIGKGKLKDELHELLKTKREVKSFVNQYDPRFGYGATEVFLGY
ncbi:Smr/MutS family protein [Parasediminibacterium sp. JCM 36343]|uniref:Smr/MutS family protein n=1 Tax=Parasediminibacterium sp. JCM 36343 TaxID=3374279 RepID=UPI003978CBA8